MRRDQDSLTVLRQDARTGVESLIDVVAAGRLMGVAAPTADALRHGLGAIDRFDVAALSADSRALVAAHRTVSEQLHHLPEQQVRLDDGWNSDSAVVAIGAVIDHQRRAESDLHMLRTLTDATSAAASGIDRLLRTFYLTVARLSVPSVAGVAPAELPQAVLTGRVPAGVVIEDIRSRVEMFTTAADATARGIAGILDILNRSLDGIDDEAYPTDARSATPEPPPVESARSAVAPPAHTGGTGHTTTGAAPDPALPDPAPSDPVPPRSWLAESTTEHLPAEAGAAAPGGSARPETSQPPAPVETVGSTRGSEDDVDVPFRLRGLAGAPPESDQAASGHPASVEPGRDGAHRQSTAPARAVADTARTPPGADPNPSGPPDRSSGDLALAGDQ